VVFTCAQWGVGVRAKLSYFGEKIRGFVPLVFFLLHDRYDRGRG
jgi:hypothetical protein